MSETVQGTSAIEAALAAIEARLGGTLSGEDRKLLRTAYIRKSRLLPSLAYWERWWDMCSDACPLYPPPPFRAGRRDLQSKSPVLEKPHRSAGPLL